MHLSTNDKLALVDLLIGGLSTDGWYHKQWYLEQAFRKLCGDKYVADAKASVEWEEGIAP